MKLNYKFALAISTFVISEVLPFFPKVESNGVIHGLISSMRRVSPGIEHDCSTHPPVEPVDESLKKIVNVFKKTPEELDEKKTILKYEMVNDINKNTKISLKVRIYKK